MRTRFLTLALLLLAFGFVTNSCTQDSINDLNTEELDVVAAKSKKAKKATRAIRGRLNNAPNPEFDLLVCDIELPDPPPDPLPPLPEIALTTNNIYGNMGHLGKIQPDSFGRPQVCTFVLADGQIVSEYLVNYIGAHGDEIQTREYVTIIPDDETFATGSFEGTIDIIGGTGRFENATGNMVFVDARFDGPISTWRVVGEITY